MGCGEEIMGLRWQSIDFDANTITIAHTVVQVNIDGKSTVVAKDRAKNKKVTAPYRSFQSIGTCCSK